MKHNNKKHISKSIKHQIYLFLVDIYNISVKFLFVITSTMDDIYIIRHQEKQKRIVYQFMVLNIPYLLPIAYHNLKKYTHVNID